MPRLGWRCGDHALDLAAAGLVGAATLQDFFAEGRAEWDAAVERIVPAVDAGAEPRYPARRGDGGAAVRGRGLRRLLRLARARHEHGPPLPARRGPAAPELALAPGRLPRARRHGRALRHGDPPTEGANPTRRGSLLRADARLDVEVELGFVVGAGSSSPVSVDAFREHVFGVVLVNDWSARDIQAWEYQPLGPFLGKSFATSISAWVTPLALLEDRRVEAPPQEPEPLPYLRGGRDWALDIELEIELNGEVLSRPNARTLYWTGPQLVAHLTSNGATLRPGDLLATGTISAPEPGSLIELGVASLSDNGTRS